MRWPTGVRLDPVMGWSLVSGLVLALAFPRPDQAAFAWFALIPLFLVMPKRPFLSGFFAGVGFFGLVLYWLNIVMTTYGRLPPLLSVVAYLLLVAYLSLFFGAATWAACRCRDKLGLSPVVTLPVFWVALEFLRSYEFHRFFLFSGFPWAILGYSQQSHLVLIQNADLFGPYGLSFLLVLSNAVFALTIKSWQEGKIAGLSRQKKLPWIALSVAGCLFLVNIGYGFYCLRHKPDERDHTMETLLVQGGVDQSIKWVPAYQSQTVALYRNLSFKQNKGPAADLIIWPESALPFYFQDNNPLSQAVRDTATLSQAFLLFGSPAYEVIGQREHYFNSAFLLSPEGAVLGRSDKVHLVPFGEYVPMGRFLPFLSKLVAGIGDFSPGTISPLPMNGAKIGVLVCFEGIFPELAREYVRQGSDLLVNITNDAWFGRSSAPFQHLAMTRFRAVENRVWLARAANTGISAIIAPSGEIIAQTPLFERLALPGRVGLEARPSLYTRFGDVFPSLFLFLAVFWLLKAHFKRTSPKT